MIGSSTGPAVFESGLPSSIEPALRMPRPRPRNLARSVSYWTAPTVSPSTAATWAIQMGFSSSSRGLRVARMA